jgi:V/A-type H+-transporting ATPase subunit E
VALDDLLTGLRAEAAAEAAALEAETRKEVQRIVEEARAEAQTVKERAIQATEDELRREVDRLLASARLAALAALREAREEAFGEFMAELRRRLASLREAGSYPSVLKALIRESLAALPAATLLRVDPRDEPLATHLLGELDTELVVVAALDTAGGIELARGDDRTVRNTIEERLANAEPALRLLFMRVQRVEAP